MNYTKHFEITSSSSLKNFFQQEPSLQNCQVDELLHFGAIYLNKKRAGIHLNTVLEKGDYLRVHTKPKRFPVPQKLEPHIVFKHTDFIIAKKPSKTPSLATLDNKIENLHYQLSLLLKTEIFPVHQLDVETSGLLIFALSKQSAKDFGRMFEDRSIHKTYRLLTRESLPCQNLVHYMKDSKHSPKELSNKEMEAFNKKCELEILSSKPIKSTESFLCDSLLYVDSVVPEDLVFESHIQLKTGRTHQIRAQIANISSGILGDTIYGTESSFPVFSLQAYHLWFNFKNKTYEFAL